MPHNAFTIKNGVLQKYHGTGGQVTIPDSVTRIGRAAFAHCETLTAVILPDSVSIVGEGAFIGCKQLASVTVPDHPLVFGEAAFRDCHQLTDAQGFIIVQGVLFQYNGPGGAVVIPEGVTRIDSWAFGTCLSLTSVVLPQGLTILGNSAFDFCARLTSVTCPDSLLFIGPAAFRNCSALTHLTLPEGPLRIGERAFLGCRSLADAQGFVIIRGVLYGHYGSDSRVIVPDSVHAIDNQVFRQHLQLTEVLLPDGLTRIGDQAFAQCKNLTDLTLPVGVRRIGRLAFSGCEALTLQWNGRCEDIGDHAFYHVHCAIMPHLPFSHFHGAEAQRMAVRGFLQAPERYVNSEIRWHYQQHALKHRTALLPEVFQDDLVRALLFYREQRQITAENFEAEYLTPALASGAAECTAFLLEFQHRELADCAPTDEFLLE